MIFRYSGGTIDVGWVHRAAVPPCRATLVRPMGRESYIAGIVVHRPGDLTRALSELGALLQPPYTVLREWDVPGGGGVCGTRAGYARHMRAGGGACDACRAANAEYNRVWRSRRARNTEETA